MVRILLILLMVVGFMFIFGAINNGGLTIEPSSQTASVLEGINTISVDFNETGTLNFYPNNIGPVPYLFYQDRSGNTVSKALTFAVSPPSNFSSWSGAHVSVTGRVNNEHVVVSRIDYISAP